MNLYICAFRFKFSIDLSENNTSDIFFFFFHDVPAGFASHHLIHPAESEETSYLEKVGMEQSVCLSNEVMLVTIHQL